MSEDEFLQRCGRFLLIERVAAGGMGEIFRGKAAGTGGRVVAIKRLLPQAKDDPVFVGMFIDEARVAQALNHPNIARLYEFGEDQGSYFLAMEWVDGASLYEVLEGLKQEGDAMPVDQASRIFAVIAGALDYVHSRVTSEGEPLHLVHRDVSPSNVMITLDGLPKLLDFGLAKARIQLQKTQPGFVKGKFGYLAPEQLEGQVDHRTDLFALGLCFFETLTGQKLFDRPSPADTVKAIRDYREAPSAHALRSDVSEALDEVLKKMLARKPDERYQTGAELRRAIESALPALTRTASDLDAANGSLVGRLYPERMLERTSSGKKRRRSSTAPDEAPPLTPAEQKWRLALWIGTGVLVLLLLVILSAGRSCGS